MNMLFMPHLAGNTNGAYSCQIQCFIRLHSVIRRVIRVFFPENSVCANPTCQLSTDLADQQTNADDACFSSRETSLHGPADASFVEYKARPVADSAHRCGKVAENQHAVVCLIIATGKLEALLLSSQHQGGRQLPDSIITRLCRILYVTASGLCATK